MKELMLLIPLGGALLLTGCAGTETEFECNATTSDTCMTMQQANEKAKSLEESASVKLVAAGLPVLAEGNFRTVSAVSLPLPPQSTISGGKSPAVQPPGLLSARTTSVNTTPVSTTISPSPVTLPGNYPRPLRKGDKTAALWIAPYIDAGDVYHQPSTVLFVVSPSAWGQPRIN
ncbi:type IV conjugative transfer system lipoprotein TraV [Klebsiella sp. BIGb0407]|uniref:type IV conjugative transfer system lipoprotein TraV n=1 Tax=Klebsiella sp. BIGb0407 TaxID=2940603 RepID=UPI0021676CB0|nr:type IV conjugative transfer system lipoprotein TraV [Klebsiella sp. BIGb0407]MCS3434227.1 conjugal transfer pilus assembly protein TraV [Klebsiella sp. BIGb0407]